MAAEFVHAVCGYDETQTYDLYFNPENVATLQPKSAGQFVYLVMVGDDAEVQAHRVVRLEPGKLDIQQVFAEIAKEQTQEQEQNEKQKET